MQYCYTHWSAALTIEHALHSWQHSCNYSTADLYQAQGCCTKVVNVTDHTYLYAFMTAAVIFDTIVGIPLTYNWHQ
jgi:hypothetical protein